MPISSLYSTSRPVLHWSPLQLHSRCRSSPPSCRQQSSSAQSVRHIRRAHGSLSSPLQIHPSWRCKGRSSRAAAITAAATDDKSLKVSFLGLGIMGTAMARNLLKAGYSVTVWNRSSEKCKELEQEGARVASSSADCVAASDITVAMLSDPPAALAVAKDAAKGLSQGKGYVDASTVDAQTAQQISQIVKEAGGTYLEAPVSGSKEPAEQGTLIFLCGGDDALFERSADLLDVMGKAKLFLGQAGNGANMKLVVNMIMGSFMAASAEGLELAKGVGLRDEDLIEVVNMAAIATPMFKLKAPSMVLGQYPTAFPLKHQQKDMRLALEAAGEGGISLPVAAAANDLYVKAMEGGHSDADFSAVKESLAAKT